MNKKLSKLLLIISIIFIGLFTNIKGVKACDYAVPMSYINGNNKATRIDVEIKYRQSFKNCIALVFNCEQWVDYTQHSYISKILAKDNGAKVGFAVDPKITDVSDGYTMSVQNQENFYFKNDSNMSVSGCPDYIKITGKVGSTVATAATAKEYETYVDTGQYSGLELENQNLFQQYNMTGIRSKTEDTNTIKNLKDENGDFSSYIGSRVVVLVNTGLAEPYPNERLTELKKDLSDAGYDAEGLVKKLGKLIDINEKNTRSYTASYYNGTHTKWYKYMQTDIKNPKGAPGQRKEIFRSWFHLTGRYIFEESLTEFKDYFTYLYESGQTELSETDYDQLLKAINGMLDLKDAKDEQTSFDNNNCYVYCKACIQGSDNYNGNACSACTSSSSDYKKCNTCTTKNCKNVPGTAHDSCLKGCMGDEMYEKYKEKVEETQKEIDQDKKDAIDKIATALSQVSMPTLNINVGKKYEIKCEDVSIFHNVYLIIVILAPAIAIALGTVDYFRAVIAGDEKKMQDQKKKLPKRIIMLVCLILVPILIKIITGMSSDLNNSLMDCIVNGN